METQEHKEPSRKQRRKAKKKGTRALHDQAIATIQRLETRHPDLIREFERAYAYAVFPEMGRASLVLGVSFGRGIVFEQEKPIGVANLTQITLGVQVGGQTFSEIVFFPDKASLDRLKRGAYAFDGNASAVLVKAAATPTTNFPGVTAKAYSQGGMLLELSMGVQKLSFTEGAPVQESPVHVREGRIQKAEPSEHEPREPREEHRGAKGAEEATATERGPGEARATDGSGPSGEARAREGRGDGGEAGDASADAGETKEGDGHRGIGERARSIARRLHLERAVPQTLRERFTTTMGKLRNEQEVSSTLHPESQAALSRMLERDPSLREKLEKAHAFAIFPSVGKTSAVLGAAYGVGEVFRRGKLIGYAGIVQLTIGVQLGGDTFAELVLIEDKGALKRFKEGKVAFAANASAVVVKAGAGASNKYRGGTAVFVAPHGGMLLEAAIGGQKFVYRPAALTRGKSLRTDVQPSA